MPNAASTVTAFPTPARSDEPPPVDGWRADGAAPPDLATLRAELDRIDNAVHDLLTERAGVVELVARSGKPAAFRPGREASIVRRLITRHTGPLPTATVFRIWRELLAGTTSMQGGFSLAVADADPGATVTQLAREHFGALTPLRLYGSPGQALADVSHGAASVAILPLASDTNTWWVSLLHHEPRLYVISRLPFWQRGRPDGAPAAQALVVAATPPDPSGQDHSFIGLECDSDVSRTRLSGQLTAAGLSPETMVLVREQGSHAAHVLIEVDGYLSDDDPRLTQLGAVFRRPVVIGSYAVPFTESV